MSAPVKTDLSTPSSVMMAILITPPELPSRAIASARPDIERQLIMVGINTTHLGLV